MDYDLEALRKSVLFGLHNWEGGGKREPHIHLFGVGTEAAVFQQGTLSQLAGKEVSTCMHTEKREKLCFSILEQVGRERPCKQKHAFTWKTFVHVF